MVVMLLLVARGVGTTIHSYSQLSLVSVHYGRARNGIIPALPGGRVRQTLWGRRLLRDPHVPRPRKRSEGSRDHSGIRNESQCRKSSER